MNEISQKTKIDIAALTAIAALAISIISLLYTRDSARAARDSAGAAIAQIRPQLYVTFSPLKRNGERIMGKLSVQNIGQTTATIDHIRLILIPDVNSPANIEYYDFLNGAIIYKNSSRDADINISSSYDFDGRKASYLEQLKRDEGVRIEMEFRCQEMPGSQFIESQICAVDLK